ncbi:CinA family protein [Mongoliimonas terrestris]|uniref:CinA family protein n=1 Tax=Mongoliimonas terrestris TaxID=1709001 RepID=UPI0009499C15|nr:CinA family protein [Mongoliimonas terrestris]
MTETLSSVLPDRVERATRDVLQAACAQSLTLATAESCTGGLIASLLTDVEGCSHAFAVGFVVYTEEAKIALVGVPADLIEAEGVVSKAVAVAMAEGALAHSRADIAISTTGFAGAAGDGDEAGLVHFACARRGRTTMHRVEHFGDIGRGAVRLACLETAIAMMGEMLR